MNIMKDICVVFFDLENQCGQISLLLQAFEGTAVHGAGPVGAKRRILCEAINISTYMSIKMSINVAK